MSDPLVNYIGISGGGLFAGLVGKIVWDWLKNGRGNNKKDILTENDHDKLCKIATLEHREFVTSQFKELKEDYLTPAFNDVFKEIRNNKNDSSTR